MGHGYNALVSGPGVGESNVDFSHFYSTVINFFCDNMGYDSIDLYNIVTRNLHKTMKVQKSENF